MDVFFHYQVILCCCLFSDGATTLIFCFEYFHSPVITWNVNVSPIFVFSKQQQTFVFEPLAEQKILRIQQQG